MLFYASYSQYISTKNIFPLPCITPFAMLNLHCQSVIFSHLLRFFPGQLVHLCMSARPSPSSLFIPLFTPKSDHSKTNFYMTPVSRELFEFHWKCVNIGSGWQRLWWRSARHRRCRRRKWQRRLTTGQSLV